ncbi:glycosyltransferase [Lysobacter sp. TY2-98]|nr:glycosyltransferase [Lysobacter sp. TY2-98]
MPRLNLIAWNNGVGLTRDLALLASALRSRGFTVHVTAIGRGKLRKWFRPLVMTWRGRLRKLVMRRPAHDVNIMLEHVRREDLGSAVATLFIPNPEWCVPVDVERLPLVQGVLAKTRHAEAIFAARGLWTRYIGFTSEDRFDPAVKRERTFFHLAGRSVNKGTNVLIEAWKRHPEWPQLVIVQSPRTATTIDPPVSNITHRIDYIDDVELRNLQNASRVHVCCSETEGFGHYLVEAMSVGAFVLTTDGAPMNELVDETRGICVPCNRTGSQHLATTYFVDEAALEAAIERALAMSDEELDATGAAARAWYLQNDAAFPDRLRTAIDAFTADVLHRAAVEPQPAHS